MMATSFILDQNLTDLTETGFLQCFRLLSMHASLGGFDFNVPLEHIEFLLGAMFLTSLELIHWTFCFAEDQDQDRNGQFQD
jgi:hypothetical protein